MYIYYYIVFTFKECNAYGIVTISSKRKHGKVVVLWLLLGRSI